MVNDFSKLIRHDWNRSHFYLLIILSIIGFYLRVEPVLLDTVHFSYDQGIDLSYVRKLVVDHKFSLIGRFTGLEGVFLGPLWTWMLAIPFIVSGGNPATSVIFLSSLGIISLWTTYLVVKRITSSEAIALLTSVFVAFSGPFIAASQIVYSPSPLTIFMILYIWFLWEIVDKDNSNFFLPLGLIIGIFFQFEIGFAIFLLPATIFSLIIFGKARRLFSKKGLLALILFALTFLPQILFELRHNFLMTKAVVRFFSGENTSLGRESANLIKRFGIRMGSLWEDFASSVTFLGREKVPLSIFVVPALLGWGLVRKEKQRRLIRLGLLLLIILASMYLGFTIFPGPVWVWYRAGLPIIFILIITIGWVKLIEKSLFWKWVITAGLFSLIIATSISKAQIVNIDKADEGSASTLRNQKYVLDYIFKDAGEESFDLYVYTPPVYTYVWDHMLFWYAEKYPNKPQDYGYQRSNSAANDFYLLIEPDDMYARIDGWKGNFESHGQFEKSWKLPGGITVEKWQAN